MTGSDIYSGLGKRFYRKNIGSKSGSLFHTHTLLLIKDTLNVYASLLSLVELHNKGEAESFIWNLIFGPLNFVSRKTVQFKYKHAIKCLK